MPVKHIQLPAGGVDVQFLDYTIRGAGIDMEGSQSQTRREVSMAVWRHAIFVLAPAALVPLHPPVSLRPYF